LLLFRDQEVVLGLEEIGPIIYRDLEVVTVRDRVLRAGLDTEPAEYASTVIDVVDLRESLIATDAIGIRTGIRFSLDIDTVRGARGSAQIARYTLLFSSLVYVKQVLAAITRLNRNRNIRVLNRPLLARDLGECPFHSLDYGDGRLDYI
jgi:hypothetical protein